MKFIVKKTFKLPDPPDGSGLEIQANLTEPAELDMLTQEQVEKYIAEGFIESYEHA